MSVNFIIYGKCVSDLGLCHFDFCRLLMQSKRRVYLMWSRVLGTNFLFYIFFSISQIQTSQPVQNDEAEIIKTPGFLNGELFNVHKYK